MTRRRRWILLPLAAVGVGLLVLALLFDWNWFKGSIEDLASAALAREFEVADLDVDLGLTPIVTLDRVRIANAEWGSRPDMLSIEQVRFAVELGPLLQGEIRLPFLRVRAPDLLLETTREGLGNWKLGEQDQPEPPPAVPIIGDLEITDAAIRYRAPDREQDVLATLQMVEGALGEGSAGARLSARGSLDRRPLSLSLAAASLAELQAEGKRFPFRLDAELGATRMMAVGSAERPLAADGLSLEISLASEELGPLLAFAGLEPRALPPLQARFTVTAQDQIWSIRSMDVRLGATDIGGTLWLDLKTKQPTVAAELRSNQVRYEDLRGAIALAREGRGREPSDEGESARADAPAELEAVKADGLGLGISSAMLPEIDAEVSYTVDRLSGPDLKLQELALYGRLHDRLPHLAVHGDGSYRERPVAVEVALGEAADSREAYPIRIELAAAETRLRAEGGLARPAELDGLRLRFDLASRDPGQVLALAELDADRIPPVDLRGHLAQDGDAWQLTDLDGRLGESDLQGRLGVDLAGRRPLVTAALLSEQVRLEDLAPLVPARAEQTVEAEAEAAVDAALVRARRALESPADAPDEPSGFRLDQDLLPPVDADISYAISRFSGPQLALSDLYLSGRLDEGLPEISLVGGGQYRDAPVVLDVRAGGAAEPAGNGRAYPVNALISAAGTEVELEGEIGRPDPLEGLELEVRAKSENVNELLALADLGLPQIPPFAITGHVVQQQDVWRISDFYGQVSESELTGEIEVDLSDERPFLTADLRSSRLLVDDLLPAGGQGDTPEEERTSSPPGAQPRADDKAIVSAEGLNFEALPAIDADVSFEGAHVVAAEFRFDRVSVDLQLRKAVAVLDASGEGQYRDGPVGFEAHAGTEESLENPDARYPIDLRLESEETAATVNGTVARPAQLAGLDVDVALSGQNLDRFGEILQLSLPTTPPFELHSHLRRDGDRWTLAGLNGTIGDSDVQGQAALVLRGERPAVEAELTSHRLDFDDLGLLVGAPVATGPGETASREQQREAAEEGATPGVLPEEPFDVPELRAIDATVSYQAERVQAPNLPLEGVVAKLRLENGQLTLDPLRFDLAGGHLESAIQLDSREEALAGGINLRVRDIRVNQLLSEFDIEIAEVEVEQEGAGTFHAGAELAVQGNSIQEIAASADGSVVAIMDGGRINALILEGLGLDLGEVLALLLTGDEEPQAEMVPVQCFIGRFAVRGGVIRTEALVLETSDSTITGRGQVDLGKETMALELVAHPKDSSVLTASTPVRLEGTFENPKADVISEELEDKGLAALALGAVLPVIGAILPFLEEGEAKGSDCARLLADARAAMPAGAPSDGAN